MELTEKIVTEQSLDVDTVSGATVSSQGFLEAVAAALEEVENNESQKNKLIQVILLGLLLLLGGTVNLGSALIIIVSSVLTAIITRIVFLAGNHYISRNSLWFILLAVGLAVANIFYTLVPVIFPFIASYINIYLLLVGLTPLVYLGCQTVSWSRFFCQ